MTNERGVPRRILIGVSCTTEEEGAPVTIHPSDRHTFEHALWLAKRTGASIRIFHAFDYFDERLVGDRYETLDEALRAPISAVLEELKQRAEREGVPTTVAMRHGPAWLELLREAHDDKSDLIVVSPRRDEHPFADRLFHGSTTRRLVDKAQAPLWVVHPDQKPGIERIMALVDQTDVADEVLSRTADLADCLDAEKIVLHCVDYPDDIAIKRLPHAERALKLYHEDMRKRMQAKIEARVGEGWEILLGEDWVARAAPKVVKARDIDLVVIAAVAYKGLRGMLLDTTAEKVLERNPTSTWVMRPTDWVAPVDFDD